MKKLAGLNLLLVLLSCVRPTAQEFSDNVVIVLDASGSMRDPLPGTSTRKMDAAKTALKSVVRTVPSTTHIGLLVFSAAGVRNDWVYPLGARNDEELAKAIDRLEPYGATPLGKYIKQGADRLLEARAKQFGYGSYRLLVVTDGEAQDRDLVDRYTPEVMARGITMDVIGVGMSQDHTLATRVHSYRRANDPEALSRAITEVFAEIGGTSTDLAQAETYDMLAGIPAEVASSMIQALSISGNHPIGTKPRALEAAQSRESARPASPAPVSPSVPPRRPAPPAPPRSDPVEFLHGIPSWAFLVAVAVLSMIVKWTLKGRR